jgi:dCMP deaminase
LRTFAAVAGQKDPVRKPDMIEPRPTIVEYKMALAVEVASRSNCMKAHVGAIIVRDDRIRATGYNGTIYGYPDCFDGGCPRCLDSKVTRGVDLDRCVCVHAEENALVSAARYGIPVEGTECYVTHEPCLTCTRLLIQAGLKTVVYLLDYEYPNTSDRNDSRRRMRDHAKDKEGTEFQQLDPSLLAVGVWQARIEAMADAAFSYARSKGVVS